MKYVEINLTEQLKAAQKTYSGKKRSELKDSDFLFPATRSFPIVLPQDVKMLLAILEDMAVKCLIKHS